MAKNQGTSGVNTHAFNKDINKDLGDIYMSESSWSHARNAINNSKTGDIGMIGNEPANELCASAPFTIIGTIHLEADKWAIFSTNNTQSEIGLYFEDTCAYNRVVRDNCLNFKIENLIKGVSRPTSDCVFELYWDDGLNPSRFMPVSIDVTLNPYTNVNSPIPWVQAIGPAPCFDQTNTSALDCSKLRVAKFINTPCVEVKRGASGGTLLNGSYMVAIAYAIRGQKISDWYVSNIQGLFDHRNEASSLDVEILSMDTRYTEVVVAVISTINQQTVARQAGIYSTHQTRLSFDNIQNEWPTIPIEQIPIMTPIPDKTDAMYNSGQYLIRVGPTSKLDFNYQPFANQIVTKWVSVEYPVDYYRKGGNKTNYLRDEVYAFFVRWVYDTGDKSASYHIPGRPKLPPDLGFTGTDALPDEIAGGFNYSWLVNNTASPIGPTTAIPLPDGGVQIQEGLMGYWESTENYPTDKPEVWDSNVGIPPYTGTFPADYNLCGKPIRHHKFPEERINPNVQLRNPVTGKVRVLGVKFENVLPPVENPNDPPANWRYLQNVVGYEILRGTRNGNKTVIAKGLVNNMVQYPIPGNPGKTGYYPNYPYNDLTVDRFISYGTQSSYVQGIAGPGAEVYTPQPANARSQNNITFHSPDTNFTNPFLASQELKIYGEMSGDSIGKFELSEKHPKEKLVTNLSFLIAAIVGMGISHLSINGLRRVNKKAPIMPGYSQDGFQYPNITGNWNGTVNLTSGTGTNTFTGSVNTSGANMAPGNNGAQPKQADNVSIGTANNAVNTGYTGYSSTVSTTVFASNVLGLPVRSTSDGSWTTLNNAYNNAITTTKAWTNSPYDIEQEDGQYQRINAVARIAAAIPMFLHYFTLGSDEAIRLIRNMIRYNDFALRYHSHCFYTTYNVSSAGNRRKQIADAQYIGPQITNMGGVRVNNLYRSRTVGINLASPLGDPSFVIDQTRVLASQVTTSGFLTDPTKAEIDASNSGGPSMKASSHYAALKQRIRNQYGQLTNIYQVPVSTCTILITKNPQGIPQISQTGVLFGGDTYVGRYTEKNTFFYFYDWLYGQPDGAQLNYKEHTMIGYPRFWANFNQFETSDFTSSFFPSLISFSLTGLALPSSYYNLDGLSVAFAGLPSSFTPGNLNVAAGFQFSVRKSWFYLFSSGIRDFMVESEINIDLRDWGEQETEQHYDPYRYTDTKAIFDTAIIKAGNYYKYDQSLSVSKLFTNYFSWATMQNRDYSPFLAETCYVYRPRRVIYSLPAQFEGRRDNWLIFLANNYYDFLNQVTCIKPVNKSGAVIFFDSASPVEFQGLDQLQTSLGTKLTIGDGGLFSQPMQALTNADRPHEYGSCQDRLSVINTPAGLFWMSQNQGKIFQLAGGPKPISDQGLKWWFTNYLPYKLTQLFPDFDLVDNPVAGIGCQAVYDNENGLAYFCKKDYTLRAGFTPGDFEYNGGRNFTYLPTGTPVVLGDPLYFEEASWTISYDVKTQGWLGWHDWHPELTMPAKNTFMTTKTNPANGQGGIWIHNERCDLYCNYYGLDYPFEVEYMVSTPQVINTLRSIEYYMEVYKYNGNCYDRFHVLDYNFDEAVVFNTEQCSGLLRLVPNPRPDPTAMITYPIINPTNIQILFSKIENKYRFNQFWDTTDDRGEFPLYPLPPGPQRMIWNTAPNGYVKNLNPLNLNYSKPEMQRKKFRHYTNSVFLRKRVIAGQQMTYKVLLLLTNNKNLYSPR